MIKINIKRLKAYKSQLLFIAFLISAICFFIGGSYGAIYFKMHRQSQGFLQEAVPQLTFQWKLTRIPNYLTDNYLHTIRWDNLHNQYKSFSKSLGPYKKINAINSSIKLNYINKKLHIKAESTAIVSFKKRQATLYITSIKQNKNWKIQNIRFGPAPRETTL